MESELNAALVPPGAAALQPGGDPQVVAHPIVVKKRVADQIVRVLHEAGVRTIFGVPGGAISAVYDALIDEPGITVINSHHESAAVFAAIGWAKATGKVGVVLTTSGPGVTNAITGVASAFCDGVPLLLIGGEVPRRNFGRGALQDGSVYQLNLVGMLKHVTKAATEITTADGAVFAVRKALSTAASGRKGPVFLSLPLDVQAAQTSVPRMAHNVESHFEVDRALLHTVTHRLLTAKTPLILAGSGLRHGKGAQELLKFAERMQIPVATTPKAKGVFPETHPLSLGIYGHGGHPSSAAYLEKGIDVLMGVGTSFGDAATNSWSEVLRPSEVFIQIDIDSGQIGRNYPADLGVIGAAEGVLRELAAMAPPLRKVIDTGGRTQHTDPSKMNAIDSPIKPQRAIWELQQILPRSTAYTCDIGDHMMFALHYLTIEQPDGFHLSSGLAAMGSSLGTAMGFKLADPDRSVVAVCGDGTMAMNGLDVQDAAQAGQNIIYLVMNDRRYGMVEEGHKSIYGRSPSFPIRTSLTKFGVGVGARVFTIDRPGQILALGAGTLLDSTCPTILDVHFDVTERMPKQARFDSLRTSLTLVGN